MTSVPDAYQYIYENVGIPTDGTVPGSYQYVYENVGIHAIPASLSYQYIYENVGFGVYLSPNAYQYTYESEVLDEFPNPKIWFTRPGAGKPRDGIMVYGFGWGATAGTYDFELQMEIEDDWIPLSISGFQVVAAGVNGYNENRKIDVGNAIITMQHQRVLILIPNEAVIPGSRIRVKTDDGA